jgi:succinyl-CoA synthetase alpha subunit
MAILALESSRIVVQGITGREAVTMVQAGLDYGSKIIGGVTPGKGGTQVHGVPVFDTLSQVLQAGLEPNVALISVPPLALADAICEAAEARLPLIVALTERAPQRDVAQALEYADRRGCRVIGPNTMGLISPEKCKIGAVGGRAEDVRRSFTPGPVGLLSRSGGMTTEIASLLTANGLGQSTCISIGGDTLIGSGFLELCQLFEQDPETKAVVLFCEPGGGGALEKPLAQWYSAEPRRIKLVAFIAGRFADQMRGVRFGHAGSIVRGEADTAAAKTQLLEEAGIHVAADISDIPRTLKASLDQ